MNPISFGNVYKVPYFAKNKSINMRHFAETSDYCRNRSIFHYLKDNENYNGNSSNEPYATAIFVTYCNKFFDQGIEAICNRLGVKFVKIDEDVAIDEKNIMSRVYEPTDERLSIAILYANAFDSFAEKQITNLSDYDSNVYYSSLRGNADGIIKSGEKFSVPTVKITAMNGVVETLKNNRYAYIEPNSIDCSFLRDKDCPYAPYIYKSMRGFGFDRIPIYVDEDTRQIGNILGIIE